MSNPRKPFCSRASPQLKGFSAIVVRDPPRIKVEWDRIAQADFEGVIIFWWRIGDPATQITRPIRQATQFFIPAKEGESYAVAARAHFVGRHPSSWTYVVTEVPEEEDRSRWIDLGELWLMDTPRGPAILLDDLRDAFS